MDELADRLEPGDISATIKAVRLKSLVEILPDGSPTTTTISIVARRLRSRAEWHGPAGQRLNLEDVEQTVAKLVKAHPDLITSKLKASPRGFPELRIWRRKF